MTFDSLTFAVFLLATWAVYWATPGWHARKVMLLVLSYVFYAAWNPFFVLLLMATTGFDWLMGRKLEGEVRTRWRRVLLLASIIVNLCALGFFKYAQFFTDTAIDLARVFGIAYRPLDLGILLPVGISFYTFESLAYVIDVFRRRSRASTSLLDYSLYVTFFPHLVAGPILRYNDFNPQTEAPKAFAETAQGRGLVLLGIGLALKVCLADLVFAPVVDAIFSPTAHPGVGETWLGATTFSLQVYCDFAGYSLCAIGVALMFGFRFPSNFESPFGAVGMVDLWNRWHISLSSWLRDYVFTPLGHYRRGRLRGHANLIFTFFLCGLWHGAAWTFVLWGGLNGVLLVAERIIRDHVWDFTRVKSEWGRAALSLATFALFAIEAVMFRAHSVRQALAMMRTMLGFGRGGDTSLVSPHDARFALAVGAVVLAAQIVSARERGWEWLDRTPTLWRAAVAAAALAAVVFSPGLNPAFIYFQF
ncbi:MAG TPA: MBOAT family O-acyltransferase [Casimicrobiaceae bacterium]|jgi:alginate O-acetyltransferase complex protein AlgI|nr:MBOAT family O-acyltransferase [Casimicrobiaceae bacterium]